MFGLQGFADCDGEGCDASDLLKIGLVPGNMLMFNVTQLTPKGWRVERTSMTELKLYCPECVVKRNAEAKRPKLSVVS